MKLATYDDGSRDGQLVVVSRDLSTAHYATGIATRLQQVLDDWNFLSPQLQDLAVTLDHGKARHAFAFDPRRCKAPLPRAFHWVDGRAWQATPGSPSALRPGGGDAFLGACEDLPGPAGDAALEAGAAIVLVTGDLPAGSPPEQALEAIRLLMLAQVLTVDGQLPPGPTFAPLAVTPDELGEAWQGGRLRLALRQVLNDQPVAPAADPADRPVGPLLAHLAGARPLRAGALVGVDAGVPQTLRLQPGDRLRAEAVGRDGQSVFGAIDLNVADPAAASD